MNIHDIKPYEGNAKKHSNDQVKRIAKSIIAFGFRQPVLLDENNVIIVGHGRFLAATEILGWKTIKEAPQAKKGEAFIPFQYATDLTKDEIRAYRIADNRLNEAVWDFELLSKEMDALEWQFNEDILMFDKDNMVNLEGASSMAGKDDEDGFDFDDKAIRFELVFSDQAAYDELSAAVKRLDKKYAMGMSMSLLQFLKDSKV